MFSVYANIGDDMSDADDDEWKIDTGRFKRVIEERYRSVREFEIAELPDKLRNKN